MALAATRLIPMRKNKGKSIGACLHNHTSYIQNPNKTEQGELVSSYQCSPLTVDEEFLLTKRLYEQTTGHSQKSDVIAYQVRQSFKPGEVTPEEANREAITLHKAAKAAFDEAGLQKSPKVKELDAEFAELLTKKKDGKCRSKGFGALPQQAFCNAKVAVVYTAALLATAVRRSGGEIVMRPFDVRHANSDLKKLVSTLKELE